MSDLEQDGLVKPDTPYQEGQLVLVTEGEYSDFHVILVARVTREFVLDDEIRSWKALQPAEVVKKYLEVSDLAAWLCRPDGPLEEIDHREAWLGAYGKVALGGNLDEE